MESIRRFYAVIRWHSAYNEYGGHPFCTLSNLRYAQDPWELQDLFDSSSTGASRDDYGVCHWTPRGFPNKRHGKTPIYLVAVLSTWYSIHDICHLSPFSSSALRGVIKNIAP